MQGRWTFPAAGVIIGLYSLSWRLTWHPVKSSGRARDRLVGAVTGLGLSESLANLLARELGSPKAIVQMARCVHRAHPNSEEILVDEMLAIKAEIDAWREKRKA